MKTLLVLLFVGFATHVLAQMPPELQGNFDPEALANRSTERYYEPLGLTDAQAEGFFQAQYDFFVTIKTARDSSGRMGMMRAIQQAVQTRDQQLKAILSEAQFEKFQILQEQQRKKMQERRRQGGSRPGGG